MPNEKEAERIVPGLFESIEDILFHVAKSIAEGQTQLDQSSMATQIKIDNDETLSKYGFEAPWYHFAETDVELKLAIHLSDEKKEIKIANKKLQYSSLRILAAPINANYTKGFSYDASLASTIKTKIVPIPSQIRKITEEG